MVLNATPVPTMIVVASSPGDRQAIERALPGCSFIFASTEEEAEAIARSNCANDFFIL